MERIKIIRTSKNYVKFSVLLNNKQIGNVYYVLESETNKLHMYSIGKVSNEIIKKTDVIARKILMKKNDI